jgi:hypothetical protein
LKSEYILTLRQEGYNHSKYIHLNDSEKQLNFNFTGRLEVQTKAPDGLGINNQLIRLYNSLGQNLLNTTTDLTGLGAFEALDIYDTYYVSLSYCRIPYSTIATFKEKTLKLEIQTLESTTSDDDFHVAFQHVIVQEEENQLSVWEVLTMQNYGNKVFNTSWLKGWIPAGSYDLTHDTMDCCFQWFDTGDYKFDPMIPLFPADTTRLSLNYKMEYNKPKQIIEKKIIYDTDTLFILVKKLPDVYVEPLAGVEQTGIETYGENEYFIFEGTGLKIGDLVQIKLTTKVSVLEMIPNLDEIWNIVKIVLPIGLLSYIFITHIKKNELEKLEEDKWRTIERLVDLEIDLIDLEISSEEFKEVEKTIQEDFDEIFERIHEIRIEQDDNQIEYNPSLELIEAVTHLINVEYEGNHLSEKSYIKILSKYEEKKKQII